MTMGFVRTLNEPLDAAAAAAAAAADDDDDDGCSITGPKC